MKKLTLILLSVLMIVTLAACGSKKCEQHVYDDCADTECNVCGDKRDSMHSWNAADCDTPKTCTVCGATEGSALGHKPADDDGDCTTEITCTVCGTTTTPAKESHTGGTATCTEKALCTVCSTAYGAIDANNHIDENTDHICDRECGKTDIGTHADSAEDNDHVCDYGCGATLEDHKGGTATCVDGKICEICGVEYEKTKNHNNHASTEFTYSENNDGTHNKLYACCETVHTESEAHTFDSTTGKCGICKVQMAVAKVTVSGTTTYYETLPEAVTAAQAKSKSTLTLLKDIDLGDEGLVITSGTFTIDLNDCTYTSTDFQAIKIEGASATITITDKGPNKTGTVKGGSYGVDVRSGGKLNITGGTITATTGIYSYIQGTINISGGTVIGTGKYKFSDAAVKIYTSDSVCNITGGTITSTQGYGVYSNSGTLNISGNTNISGTSGYGVYGSGTITISGGNISGGVAVIGGTTTISGGSISGGTADLYVEGSKGILNLTLGEGKTEGATFPDGITFKVNDASVSTLAELLADTAAYWGVVDGKNTMLAVADDATSITDKGDITIRAICDHSHSEDKYSNNGDGTHDKVCSECDFVKVDNEKHTAVADSYNCICGATVVAVIDGTLGGKTTATEEDINALVDQLKAYVDNGITTIVVTGSEPAMIEVEGYTISAIGAAIYNLSGAGIEEDSTYLGKIDLILPDVTEIVATEFYTVFALNSITLPKVTTVGDGAFAGCYYLKKMTFGSVVTSINQSNHYVFYEVGKKVDGGLCDLVLNCGQLETEDTYKPDLENNVWFKPSWGGNVSWKSITLTHTGECDECTVTE